MEILFARKHNTQDQAMFTSTFGAGCGTALTDSQARECIEAGASNLFVALSDGREVRPFEAWTSLLPAEQACIAGLLGADLEEYARSQRELARSEAHEANLLQQVAGRRLEEARRAVEDAHLHQLFPSEQASLARAWLLACEAFTEAQNAYCAAALRSDRLHKQAKG